MNVKIGTIMGGIVNVNNRREIDSIDIDNITEIQIYQEHTD